MANLTQKLKNRARREEQRENWSAAIELYSRALRATERDGAVDVSLYNRIGDIHLRLDDMDSAVGYYERAISRYAEQDLYTSAIALCNKVLRIQPARISTYLQLGRLQLETGLMAEARVNYLRYATELLTRGQSDEAHAALEEYVVRTEDLNSALRFAGALVSNDRSEEALSLLEKLRGRLEQLGRDVAPLDRPIAAIRGFDVREAAEPGPRPEAPSETGRTVDALEAEMAGALDEPTQEIDAASIVDLEAELEAAVGEELEPAAEDDLLVRPPSDVPAPREEPTPAPDGATPSAPGAAIEEAPSAQEPAAAEEPAAVEEPALSVPPWETEGEERDDLGDDVAGAAFAAEDAEPAERAPEEQGLAAATRADSSEGSMQPLEDTATARLAEEGAEPAEADPTPLLFVAEPDPPEAVEEEGRGARVPPEEAEWADAGPALWSEPSPDAVDLAEESATADTSADERAPVEASEQLEDWDEALPAAEADAPAVAPEDADEGWADEEDRWDAASGLPGVERPERADRGPWDVPKPEEGGFEAPERSLSAGPERERRAARRLEADAPEADALAPAAWLGIQLADHDLDGAEVEGAPSPWEEDTALGQVERPELEAAQTEEVAADPWADGVAPVEGEEDGAAPPPAEAAPSKAAHGAAAAEPAEDAEPLRGDPDADHEIGRAHLGAGRKLAERGHLERAIEELELAAESSECFVEAYHLIQECRERLASEAEPVAEPVADAPDVAAAPAAEAEPVADVPDGAAEPVAEPVADAPDVAAAPAAEADVARPPAAPKPVAPREEPVAPAAEELEEVPEVAVGPAERSRMPWLFAPARETADTAAEAGAAGRDADEGDLLDHTEIGPAGGEPPDDAFRQWLAAASADVLKRAHEELERRDEISRALCVIERMLELEPGQPSLLRKRIAHAAELGRDEILPEAYMSLGDALRAGGDLPGAHGAFERVRELDPDRADARERLAMIERRLQEAGVELRAPVGDDELLDEAEEEDLAALPIKPYTATTIGPSAGTPRVEEGEEPATDEPRVRVYRGVVQDIEADWPAGREAPASYDPLEAGMEATVDFDVILAELKDQLADGAASEPDGSSRAEVGERLLDMGLLDDAIRELQGAVRVPDAPPRAFELLGRAFIEKGQARVACRLLAEALEKLSSGVEEELLLGVIYQLGVAYQDAEMPEEALACYERIFSVDIDYRDVRERMEECAAA